MSGAAGDRLARMLALVPWLTAHDGISMAECAAHFGVSEDQLERDLWLLVVCGVPGYGPDQLVDIDFWDDGLIHVIDPQTLDRPLRLTHEESLTLLMSLRMLAQLPGVDDRDAIVSAAAKLERLASETGSDRFVAVQVPIEPAVREAVDTALAGHRELRIRYASATKDEVTQRTIRPLALLSVDGVSYLEAHCLSTDAFRTFRLDRMLSAVVGEPIPALEQTAAEDLGPATPASAQQTAVLALAPAARWILDVHRADELGPDAEAGWVRARIPVHSSEWVVRLVLSLRGSARVVEPAEISAEVAHWAEAALAGYPDDVG